MRFAKITFLIAGIWGLVVLTPMYFLEQTISLKTPPAITHPEYFYGFIGVGLAWQIGFLVISNDPIRFRPLMIPCILEKFSFVIACALLRWQHRVPDSMFGASMADLVLGVLFVISYAKTTRTVQPLSQQQSVQRAHSK